jgi:regulatory protein
MRKGRSVSHAGRNAGGPRDDFSGGSDSSYPPGSPGGFDTSSHSDPADAFDPFESFDAHDRAAGHGHATAATAGSPAEAVASSEPTYTRSRRAPGEAKPGDDRAGKSQRPVRSLKGRALGYLSRREYSRAELSRKLTPFLEEADSPEKLETLLDSLEGEGWLSDSRFAESLVHRRASRLGASRIVGELKRHAVGQTLIEEASAQLRETELTRAQAVWRKKFGQLPETPAERAKQARFLASRGFSGATIGKILKGFEDEWAGD